MNIDTAFYLFMAVVGLLLLVIGILLYAHKNH
jgi:hypothetical protein